LEIALTEAAELSRPKQLLFAALRSIGGSLVFGLAAVGLLWLRRRTTTRLLAETERRLERLLPGEFASGRPSRLDRAARRADGTVRRGPAHPVALVDFLRPAAVPVYTSVGRIAAGLPFDLFSRLGLSIVHAIPGLFTAAVILFITRLLVHASNTFFDNVERKTCRSPGCIRIRQTPRILVSALLWLLGLVLAYPYLRVATRMRSRVSVFIGLIVSLDRPASSTRL
jgi:hypothetical protein